MYCYDTLERKNVFINCCFFLLSEFDKVFFFFFNIFLLFFPVDLYDLSYPELHSTLSPLSGAESRRNHDVPNVQPLVQFPAALKLRCGSS